MGFNKEEIENFKNRLTIDEIEIILIYFNASPIKQNNIIVSKTICHSGTTHKLYYYDNTKLFKCYTGCGHDAFDIYELVIKVLSEQEIEIGIDKAINILCDILNIKVNTFNFKPNENNLITKQQKLLAKEKETKNEYKYEPYSAEVLTFLDEVVVKEWEDEGINEHSHKKYGIRFFSPTGQIIIPHYDIDSNLIGIRGRYLEDFMAKQYGKYKPVYIQNTLYSHPLSFSLYGVNFSKIAIIQTKKAIIFESEKSVMMYNSYFGDENNIAVACCGSSISTHQINLLLSLGVNEIIIAFDRQYKEVDDEENLHYIQNILKIGEKMINYCNVSVVYDKEHLLGYKDSPIDRGADVFVELFNNRIQLTEQFFK